MNRALLGKMTVTRFSFVFSVCLLTLLIWGCTTVNSLVNGNTTEQVVQTTAGYNSTSNRTVNDLGRTALSFACGDKSQDCPNICEICQHYFGAPSMECLSVILDHSCLPPFTNGMASLNNSDWCNWGRVNSLYSNLSFCTERISDCLLIPWPNKLVEKIFVDFHSKFFQECPTEEFSDPPPAIIFALVITPICLIPVMVSLVVLKTKNGDGTS